MVVGSADSNWGVMIVGGPGGTVSGGGASFDGSMTLGGGSMVIGGGDGGQLMGIMSNFSGTSTIDITGGGGQPMGIIGNFADAATGSMSIGGTVGSVFSTGDYVPSTSYSLPGAGAQPGVTTGGGGSVVSSGGSSSQVAPGSSTQTSSQMPPSLTPPQIPAGTITPPPSLSGGGAVAPTLTSPPSQVGGSASVSAPPAPPAVAGGGAVAPDLTKPPVDTGSPTGSSVPPTPVVPDIPSPDQALDATPDQLSLMKDELAAASTDAQKKAIYDKYMAKPEAGPWKSQMFGAYSASLSPAGKAGLASFFLVAEFKTNLSAANTMDERYVVMLKYMSLAKMNGDTTASKAIYTTYYNSGSAAEKALNDKRGWPIV